MKDFMLIFINSKKPTAPTPEEMQNNMQLWFSWIDRLKAQGIYLGGEALTPAAKLVKGNHPVITDGPFAESKEVVGGFFIVNAKDIDDALSLTKDYPDYDKGGKVQVRQVMKM